MMIRRLAVALAIAGLLGASSVQAHDAQRQAQLIDELLRLSSENVPERIVIKQIQAWCFRFELDGDDIVELHTLGVSDDIIEALIDTAFEDLDCEDDDYEYVWYRAAYSPWWCVPYVWGYYWWDPWPIYYVNHHYYYPYWYAGHYYGYGYGHHDGYYGWRGSHYYVTYNPRKRPARRDREPGLSVVRGTTATPVAAGGGVIARQPTRGAGVVVTPNDRIETRRSPSVTPRTGGAATEATPPRRSSARPRLSPAERVDVPRSTTARPAATPRKRPEVTPTPPRRAAEPRTVAPAPRNGDTLPSPAERVAPRTRTRSVTPSTPAKRVETGVRSPRRSTPAPPKNVERPARKESKYTAPSRRSTSKRVTPSRTPTKHVAPRPSKRSQVKSPVRSKSSKHSVSRPSAPRSRSSLSRPSRSGSSRSSISRPSSKSRSSVSSPRSSSRARGRR